ncbi:ABC transporter permease [Patescibacteria group bacterium]|nr:ABC transporter permease [Patescibacteria group bacterium]MCG2694525.1 ABC transporter permease [Candidatus Parcubacteria bacterium]
MKIKYLYKTAFTGLKTNKVRSFLTILGIVIGISAIILIFSLGKGVESLITGELSGMGADTIVIRPGQEPKGLNDLAETLFLDSLTDKDVEALKRKNNVPNLSKIAPAVIVSGSISYKGETFRGTNLGWTADLMEEMYGVELESGVLFDERDIRNKASVVIIGSKVKDELFEDEENVLGKNIRIKGRNLKVVGIFSSRGQVAGFNIDEIVLIPYSTAQVYLMGINYYHEIITKADDPENVSKMVTDIEETLREQHDITDPSKDDFFVVTPEGMLDQIGSILGALTIFLSAVVGIALVVGGVGVMNIMLVSVTERTKEIGLRKAIGATNSDILTQFLFEAMILTITGGIIGILLGASLSLVSTILIVSFSTYSWTFIFPIGAAVLGIVVSAGIGLVFGLYPARKASHKSPIEALRYE